MRIVRRAAAALGTAALFGALLGATGCQSQWYEEQERGEIVRTYVVVRTEPSGALIYFDGTRMDTAPVRIPVDYEHITQQWFRQTNWGAQIRESTGTLGTILLFPVWIPASLFHGSQEMRRHVYTADRHVVSARLDGWQDADVEVVLRGEEEREVRVPLVPIGP